MSDDGQPPLTLEEHRELSEEIKHTRARLLQVYSLVAGVYGPQNRSGFELKKLNDTIDRVCEELRAQARQDCPGLDVDGLY